MIGNKGKNIVGVVTFTCYEDGTCDFTQDAPYKTPEGFQALKRAHKSMINKLRDNLRYQDKCPYSPDNPKAYDYAESPNTIFTGGGKTTQ